MGLCWSRRMTAEDRAQEKVAEFVRYAITSDIVQLRAMITKQKMDPNAKDRFGMNAVHWASYVGELGCIQELIKAGGSPSAVDSNGRNALHHACRKDHDEVVRYLVTTAKVNINSRSENQDTPLHKAVRGKSIKVLEMLLKLGADPNLRNEQGRTPLEELELLIEGAKPAPTNEGNGLTQVTSAQLASRRETYNEPVHVPQEPRPLHFIGLALQPIQRGSRTIERTDVRSFKSRLSIRDHSEHTARRSSISDEPSQWATTAIPKPAASISASLFKKNHTQQRKTFRDAGKRVIMAIRVKSALSATDKLDLMRLMLQKHTISPST